MGIDLFRIILVWHNGVNRTAEDKTSILFDKTERIFRHIAYRYAIVAHKSAFKGIVHSVFPVFGDSVITDGGAYYGTYGCAVTIGIETCAYG